MKTVRTLLLAAAMGLASTHAACAQNPYASAQSVAARGQNPWLYGTGANPYTPNFGNVSPYMPVPPVGAVGNPFLPWGYGGFGGGAAIMGEAQLLQAYGSVIINQEQGRLLREQAMQAKIDTARKRFDFDLYVRANTPTFSDEQKRIARNTLSRIQISSNPAEIASGKALNILLDDIRKFPLKKATIEAYPLSEDVLRQLNVTTKTLGVGLLRNDGKFTWPVALQDLIPAEQRKALEKQVQIAAANAAAGKIDGQILADIGLRMEDVKRTLQAKVGDIPPSQYLNADRFLSEFRDARQAIEEGQMAVQDKFSRFVVGGKSMQDVADYMVSNGLRFAPASSNDVAGYQALFDGLRHFDIALNTTTPVSESEKQQ